MFLGERKLRGRLLKPIHGVSGIYVVNALKNQFKDDPFQVGDIIFAVKDKPFTDDPIGQFKRYIGRKKEHHGTLRFTRWRQGWIAFAPAPHTEEVS